MDVRKKIVVTGASGTVGYEVVKQLHQKNKYDITVFDIKTNTSQKKFAPFKKDIQIIYGDISNPNDVQKIGKNIDTVIHLAAIIPPLADENTALAHRVNTVGTKNLITALEKNSPNAFLVYSSSISVYGDRITNPNITVNDPLLPSEGDHYAVTKIKSEQMIQNSSLNWSIFRLAAIMGNHKMSKLMFHQPLNTSLEIATPTDTARAFVNAIEKKEELSEKIFNLGGGKNCRTTYEKFLEDSFKIAGLGKLDFPPNSFAEKNFHCGFYSDGDDLERILKFRKDNLKDYFEKEKQKVSTFRKTITRLFKMPIKMYLQKQSEPLQAFRKKEAILMKHFFNL